MNSPSAPSLEAAVCFGTVEDVRALIQSGAQVTGWRSCKEETLLMLALSRAAREPDVALQLAQLLLEVVPPGEAGKFVTERSSKYTDSNSALHLAVYAVSPVQTTIVKLLLDKGALPLAKNYWGGTPLHAAALLAPVEVISLLIEKISNVTPKTYWDERTPLHFAALRDDPRIIQALLSKVNNNSNINPRSAVPSDCETPLHAAAAIGNAEVVKVILEKMASNDSDSREPRSCDLGATPLMLLSRAAQWISPRDALATASALLDKSKDGVSAQATNGYTPLHFAAASGNLELVKLLVQRGANPLLEAKEPGSTPAALSSKAGVPEVAEYLRMITGDAPPPVNVRPQRNVRPQAPPPPPVNATVSFVPPQPVESPAAAAPPPPPPPPISAIFSPALIKGGGRKKKPSAKKP